MYIYTIMCVCICIYIYAIMRLYIVMYIYICEHKHVYVYIIISQPFLLRTGMTRPSLFECRAPEAHETLGGLCVSTGALTLSAGET